MNSSNKFFINNINKFSLINSFNFKNYYKIDVLDKMVVGLKINSSDFEDTAVVFPRALWLLEHVSMKKPLLSTLKTKRIGRNERRIFFFVKVTLRGSNLLNFIYFYNCFVLKIIIKKLLHYNIKIDKSHGNYNFVIKDINVFPGYLEDFFKWPYLIFLNLILTSYKIPINMMVLQNLGFYIR